MSGQLSRKEKAAVSTKEHLPSNRIICHDLSRLEKGEWTRC
jgi:hypothetical protein